MMTPLLFCIGILPLLVIGICAVRLLEGKTTVMSPGERFIYGSIIGPVLVTEIVFLLVAGGIMRIHLGTFALAIGLLLSVLGIPLAVRKPWKCLSFAALQAVPRCLLNTFRSTARWKAVLIAILFVWIALKMAAGIVVMMEDPVYNDDVFNNWNLRAKVLMHEQTFVLDLTPDDGNASPGVAAYPPTVALIRVWLALASGGWNDHVIALIAPWQYLLALGLVFFGISRFRKRGWGLLGIYLFSSLPLAVVHGITPYADLFLALHIAIVLLPLYNAATSREPSTIMGWLRIGALATALLPMTKNEALLIHLPLLTLIALLTVVWMALKQRLRQQEVLHALLWYISCIAVFLLPWLLYKWSNGLAFGNAKSVDLQIACDPLVLKALLTTWVYEGNFLLLPGLCTALLLLRHRTALRSPLLILTAFICITVLGLVSIFTCTGLAIEAMKQTGSGRSIIQILPVIVILTTLLMAECFVDRERCSE